jgi:hypothetical protein
VPSIYTTWLACTIFFALLRFCCLSSTQLWPKQVSSQPLDLLHSPHPARQHHGCYSPRPARPTLIWCLQCIATRYCIKIELRFTLFRALRPAPFATAYLTCASTRIPPAPTCATLRLDHSELHTVHAQCHAALLSLAVLRGRRLRQARAAPPRDAHCWRQRRCAMRTATTSAAACAALTVSITPDLICATSDTAGVLPCICFPYASLCALCLHRPLAVTARHARLVQ